MNQEHVGSKEHLQTVTNNAYTAGGFRDIVGFGLRVYLLGASREWRKGKLQQYWLLYRV